MIGKVTILNRDYEFSTFAKLHYDLAMTNITLNKIPDSYNGPVIAFGDLKNKDLRISTDYGELPKCKNTVLVVIRK